MIRSVVALAALALVSTGAGIPVHDRIREAAEAFANGDLDRAQAFLEEALDQASDPGLVSFNLGLVLYRKGDDRQAELWLRRSLGDDVMPAARRARALYNLGNCLTRQAGTADIPRLQDAIEAYEEALAGPLDDGTRNDVRHNLAVAKVLLAQARSRRPPNQKDSGWDEPRGPKDPAGGSSGKESNGGNPTVKKGDPEPVKPIAKGSGSTVPGAPKDGLRPTPGQGRLPVILDQERPARLSPEDARAVLRQVVERLHQERSRLRAEAAQGEQPRANDW